MRQLLGSRWKSTILTLGVVAASLPVPVAAAVQPAAAPVASQVVAQATLSVGEAIQAADGTDASVQGYVVGQPTATDVVITDGFVTDYALALAASPTETDTSNMLYVQIPSAFRAEYGLASNPGLVGTTLTATGTVETYFSHAGLKSVSGFAGGADPDPDPDDPDPDPDDPGVPSEYYADAEGKTGDELKAALNGIVSEATVLSYSQVWDALKDSDEDPNNAANVILLYSGRSQSENDNGGDSGDWNREHVWAKSHGDFGTSPGPGTDVHHLRPTDVGVNSIRGNKDFDNGGSEVSAAPGNFTDHDSWEPRDEVKGDVARMIFYMAVRYEGTGGAPDLELNDQVNNGSAPAMGRLSVLLDWHAADPPDAFEQNRNDVIFESWQHNRNPFIDRPEWAGSIWN